MLIIMLEKDTSVQERRQEERQYIKKLEEEQLLQQRRPTVLQLKIGINSQNLGWCGGRKKRSCRRNPGLTHGRKQQKQQQRWEKGKKQPFYKVVMGLHKKTRAAVASEASQSRTPKSMLMVIINSILLSAIHPMWTSTCGLSLTALFVTLCCHL